MNENQQIITENGIERARDILMSLIGAGLLMVSTHGVFTGAYDHNNFTSKELSAKVAAELHTHSDIHLNHNKVMIDPKSLRSVRSEGDKVAEKDPNRSNWDVYCS